MILRSFYAGSEVVVLDELENVRIFDVGSKLSKLIGLKFTLNLVLFVDELFFILKKMN